MLAASEKCLETEESEMLAAAHRRRPTSPITQTQAPRRATPEEGPLPHLLAEIDPITVPGLRVTTETLAIILTLAATIRAAELRDDLATTHTIC